jgi:HD-GYP domain-containing protein (c-di-GMP phosphodiesterase class II)
MVIAKGNFAQCLFFYPNKKTRLRFLGEEKKNLFWHSKEALTILLTMPATDSGPLHYLLRVILREMVNIKIFLTAFIIGVIINWTTMGHAFSSWIPFAVPVIVQIFSRTLMRIQYRAKDQLLYLPAQRKDPAFVMNRQGKILYSDGLTRKRFRKEKIRTLQDFTDQKCLNMILHEIDRPESERNPVEYRHPDDQKWYLIDYSLNPDDAHLILVWFQDISGTKVVLDHLVGVQKFSQEVQSRLDDIVDSHQTWGELANLILGDSFRAVFVSERDHDGYLGQVFKSEKGRLIHSPYLRIDARSKVPLLASREQKKVVSGRRDDFADQDEFFSSFPFHPNVQEFIDEPIRNFINFHTQDLSIIAFNRPGMIGPLEEMAMEILVNTAWSIRNLVAMAEDNQNRFIQSIEGLCAAAEFSDEITGQHIYRVNRYSQFLAGRLGLERKKTKTIGQVAAIHDIGKVAIPHLIKLERAYTPEERFQMQMHTVFGAQILDKMLLHDDSDPRMHMARTIALCHHQQWDGQGYPGILLPDGSWTDFRSRDISLYAGLSPLKGEEIPQEALIVSLADKYDALRSPRQYKPGFSHEKTKGILSLDDRSGARGQDVFGEELFSIFEKHHQEMDEIFETMQDRTEG